jgi:hypothetical protein
MDESLQQAVRLFNDGRYSEFQDALEAMISATRAASERQFYALLDNLAEAMLQLSDGDFTDAEQMIASALRKLDDHLPRFRGLSTEALRDDFRRILVEIREVQAGRKFELAPSKLPRLRVLAD